MKFQQLKKLVLNKRAQNCSKWIIGAENGWAHLGSFLKIYFMPESMPNLSEIVANRITFFCGFYRRYAICTYIELSQRRCLERTTIKIQHYRQLLI